MEYLNIIYLNSLSCLIIILNGISFKKILKFEQNEDNFLEDGLYGLILISLITFITNFFIKISSNISLLILIIPIIFSIKDIIFKRKIILYSICLGLISSFIMYLDNTNRPDAGLYHLPFINIINDSKIILGSANLEFRYGHTSILQYLSASFNNIIFSELGILLPLSNIFSFVILYFFNLIKKNNNILLKVFFFIFLFNILYSMNRYSGFGNDDPGHMFYYLAVCNLLYFYVIPNKEKIKNVIFFSLFAFLIKPFLILVFLFPLLLILDKKIRIFSKTNIFCSIIIGLWFIKNILISSCALYPAPVSCIKSLEWSTYNFKVSNPERVSITSEAWAKDWPNNKKIISKKDYIKNFNWVGTWKNNHLKVVVKELVPQILLLIFTIIFFRNNNEINFENSLKIKIFLIGLLSFILWFLKFPIYRYGQAYVITFLNSLFLLFTISQIKILKVKTVNMQKFINIILILAVTGLFYKNSMRIYKKMSQNYLTSPWPKMYSFTKDNNKNNNIKIYSKNNQFLYYKPYPYSLCMFSNSPCTANLNVGEIRKKTKFGYKIFYK